MKVHSYPIHMPVISNSYATNIPLISHSIPLKHIGIPICWSAHLRSWTSPCSPRSNERNAIWTSSADQPCWQCRRYLGHQLKLSYTRWMNIVMGQNMVNMVKYCIGWTSNFTILIYVWVHQATGLLMKPATSTLKTNLQAPMNARVYVNLPEGNI